MRLTACLILCWTLGCAGAQSPEERADSETVYALAATDSQGRYLDGGARYRLTLPKDILAKDFWSVVVYDPQTRSLLQTPRSTRPSLNSQSGPAATNPDGSTTIYFGPEAPVGKESNWIETVPGKGWFTILRLYGPLETWFSGAWRPGEIELDQ